MRDHMNNFTEMNLDIIKKLPTPEERLKFIPEKNGFYEFRIGRAHRYNA